MKAFLARFQPLVLFVLSGFDRLRLCGESRLLNHSLGVQSYCHQQRILFKDFPKHAEKLTQTLREQTKANLGPVPCIHLNSPDVDKEAIALQTAREHGRTSGRIALITCQESALTYRTRGNAAGLIEPRKEKTRCVHYYHYFLHEQFGLCYVRIQSWFPFAVRVGLNGRRWLAQQLDNRGVGYQRRDNLITAVADVALAQQLLDEQVHADWPYLLEQLVRPLHPLWDYLHQPTVKAPFYWMTEQSEWATDYLFRSQEALAAWYPRFLRHGIETLSCKDVLRYLGKGVPANGYGTCSGEAKIDLRTRADGTRLKFWYNTNALKFYDKEQQALRIETTINDPSGFKVFRAKEGEAANAPKSWQQLRKGVADLARRAEVSAAANSRLAASLATVPEPSELGQLLEPLGRPVMQEGRRVARPLNPLTGQDGNLVRALAAGNYLLNGFRNRDLRQSLFGDCAEPGRPTPASGEGNAPVGVAPGTWPDHQGDQDAPLPLEPQGRRIATALLAAYGTSVDRLTQVA